MSKVKMTLSKMMNIFLFFVIYLLGFIIQGKIIYEVTGPFSHLFEEFYKDKDLMHYMTSPLKEEYADIHIDDKYADVQYFFDVLESSCASLPYMEKEYNFSANELEARYLEIISDASSDYEYVGTLIAMIHSIPSDHIGHLAPDYDRYFIEYGSAYENMITTINLDSDCIRMCNSWDRLLTEKGKEHNSDKSVLIMRNGNDLYEYYFYENNTVSFSNIKEILTYNGLNYDDYTLNELTAEKMQFDRKEKKLVKWKHNLYFEPSETSHSVIVKALMTDGTIKDIEMYNDYCRDIAISHYRNSKEFAEENSNVSQNPYKILYYYDDVENNTGYISINQFHYSYTDMWNNAIDEISSKNLIVDLRKCIGGQEGFFTDVIYPSLVNENMEMLLDAYVPLTEYTCRESFYTKKIDIVKANLFSELLEPPFLQTNQKFFHQRERIYLNGGNSKFKEIYILVGDDTYSCGDKMAYIMKNCKNVTVIGHNTKGDGLGSGSLCSSLTFRKSIYAEQMPESKLFFTYTPQISINEDGKVNQVFGTPPDVYVEYTDENVLSESVMKISEENNDPYAPYTYNNRRIWDTVLNTAVAMSTEDSKEDIR